MAGGDMDPGCRVIVEKESTGMKLTETELKGAWIIDVMPYNDNPPDCG
jgi:hypothetical protein